MPNGFLNLVNRNGINYWITEDVALLVPGPEGSILSTEGGVATWVSPFILGDFVTAVTASSPLQSSGGLTPNISISSTTGTGAVVLATAPVFPSTIDVQGVASVYPGGTSGLIANFFMPALEASSQTYIVIGTAVGVDNSVALSYNNNATVASRFLGIGFAGRADGLRVFQDQAVSALGTFSAAGTVKVGTGAGFLLSYVSGLPNFGYLSVGGGPNVQIDDQGNVVLPGQITSPIFKVNPDPTNYVDTGIIHGNATDTIILNGDPGTSSAVKIYSPSLNETYAKFGEGLFAITSQGSARLNTSQTTNNKILALYDVGIADPLATAVNFFGLGVNTGFLRFQTPVLDNQFNFFCNNQEIFTLYGNATRTVFGSPTTSVTIQASGPLTLAGTSLINNAGQDMTYFFQPSGTYVTSMNGNGGAALSGTITTNILSWVRIGKMVNMTIHYEQNVTSFPGGSTVYEMVLPVQAPAALFTDGMFLLTNISQLSSFAAGTEYACKFITGTQIQFFTLTGGTWGTCPLASPNTIKVQMSFTYIST